MQEQATNLADLKIGDEVAMQAGFSGDYNIYRIRSISARGIIELTNGAKYRMNGTPLAKGERWHRPESIQPVTDVIRKINKKNSLVRSLGAIHYDEWKKLDLETLEAVAALIWKPEV